MATKATASRMDLTPYGIRLVLRKGMSIELENLGPSRLAQGSFSQTQGRFDLPSGTYSLGPELGSGQYGKTFQAIHAQSNKVFAIKVEHVKNVDKITNVIKESIINILMEKESEHQPDGPYVPRFYEIAYDPIRQLMLLRIERLQGVVRSLIQASTAEQNDLLVPQIVGDVAHIMNFYHKTLHFNHRDLKSDNIGYVMDSNKPAPKLIDFGFSCITWKGVQISGALYFHVTDPCYLPTRDMMQFLYELISFERHRFSGRLQVLLETMLTFPLDNKTCRLFQGCSYKNQQLGHKAWEPLYDFLNNRTVHNPHTEPQALHRHMLEFLGQVPTKRTTPITPADPYITAQIKHCLPEQVFNPKTRRCVRRSGKVGRRVQKETQRRTPTPTARTRKSKACKVGQTRNPATGRCRYSCPSTYIRDPATQRCVSRQGPVGRKLVAMGVVASPRG